MSVISTRSAALGLRSRTRAARRRRTNWWLSALAIVVFSVVFLVPFAFIVLTAIKDPREASLLSFSLPTHPQIVENFKQVLEEQDYLLIIAFINSTVLTVASVTLMVILASMVAFVLQRRASRWNGLINFLVLSGLIIPPAVVPTIWVLQSLHLFKTLGGLILIEVAFEDIAKLDVYRRSCAYTGPVRIIHGDQDEIAPIAYARRYLDHYRGNAELEVVPGAGHAWSTVPHRTRLQQSTLEYFCRHLHP